MIGTATRPSFTVLLGGALIPTSRLRYQVAGTRVIAADVGMAHAAVLGLSVELWVGDFDSASTALQAVYSDVTRQVHPADKDKTDGEIAIEAAIGRGAGKLVLAGGLGGQTDHALGHLALLLSLARRGVEAFATSGAEEAYPLTAGRTRLQLPVGSRLSVIAFSDLDSLHIKGVRWPLEAAAIAAGSTRTLSNIAQGDVELELGAGTGLVIAYPGGE